MNHIEAIRTRLREAYLSHTWFVTEEEEVFSPSERFCIHWKSLYTETLDWTMTHVSVYKTGVSAPMFDFLTNEERFFYDWLQASGSEYLICSEYLCGGQTVIDLDAAKMASYSPGTDGFIWTAFSLSPDASVLAVLGCYWACPTVLKLYDFTEPLQLPLPELAEISLLNNRECITGWTENGHILLAKRLYKGDPEQNNPPGIEERRLDMSSLIKNTAVVYPDDLVFRKKCNILMQKLEYAGTEFLAEEMNKLLSDLLYVFDNTNALSRSDKVVFTELKNELLRAVSIHEKFRAELRNVYFSLSNSRRNQLFEEYI